MQTTTVRSAKRERAGLARVSGLLAMLGAAAVVCILLIPRLSSANASGCTLIPDTEPGLDSSCEGSGDGCYSCEYSDPYGYTTCAESPDRTTIYCNAGQHAQHQYAP
jgi:hypothetical protein